MEADSDKKIRRRAVKTRSRFTTLLTVYFFVTLIVPNLVLANTEPYSLWTVEALILMPLGFYMMWSVALRRSGVMIWLAFPFIFFCAFQIADHLICNEAVFCTVGQVPVDPKNKIVGCNGLTIAPYQAVL